MAPIVRTIMNINDGIVSIITCGSMDKERRTYVAPKYKEHNLQHLSLRGQTRFILQKASEAVRKVNNNQTKKNNSK